MVDGSPAGRAAAAGLAGAGAHGSTTTTGDAPRLALLATPAAADGVAAPHGSTAAGEVDATVAAAAAAAAVGVGAARPQASDTGSAAGVMNSDRGCGNRLKRMAISARRPSMASSEQADYGPWPTSARLQVRATIKAQVFASGTPRIDIATESTSIFILVKDHEPSKNDRVRNSTFNIQLLL